MDGEGEIGRSAERADRHLLWATVKSSMPLAFDNYSRTVLHDATKYELVVVCIARVQTLRHIVTNFFTDIFLRYFDMCNITKLITKLIFIRFILCDNALFSYF